MVFSHKCRLPMMPCERMQLHRRWILDRRTPTSYFILNICQIFKFQRFTNHQYLNFLKNWTGNSDHNFWKLKHFPTTCEYCLTHSRKPRRPIIQLLDQTKKSSISSQFSRQIWETFTSDAWKQTDGKMEKTAWVGSRGSDQRTTQIWLRTKVASSCSDPLSRPPSGAVWKSRNIPGSVSQTWRTKLGHSNPLLSNL